MSPYGPAIAGLAWLASLAAAFGAGWKWGDDNVRGKWDADRAATLEAYVNDMQAAREKEHRLARMLAEVAEQHDRELQDAQDRTDRLAADLRAGNVRLQQRWQACAATASVSGAAVAAAIADDRSDDRAESASRIVRAAAECDAQVRGLQALIRAERQ